MLLTREIIVCSNKEHKDKLALEFCSNGCSLCEECFGKMFNANENCPSCSKESHHIC